MSIHERISSEELAQEALLAERKRIENAVYRSGVALRDALDDTQVSDDAGLEHLIEQIADHLGLRNQLQAHKAKHGAEIFEDAYESRRLEMGRKRA